MASKSVSARLPSMKTSSTQARFSTLHSVFLSLLLSVLLWDGNPAHEGFACLYIQTLCGSPLTWTHPTISYITQMCCIQPGAHKSLSPLLNPSEPLELAAASSNTHTHTHIHNHLCEPGYQCDSPPPIASSSSTWTNQTKSGVRNQLNYYHSNFKLWAGLCVDRKYESHNAIPLPSAWM